MEDVCIRGVTGEKGLVGKPVVGLVWRVSSSSCIVGKSLGTRLNKINITPWKECGIFIRFLTLLRAFQSRNETCFAGEEESARLNMTGTSN